MGDFLSRLADRTLETAPVAKPALAPAFAPAPGGPARADGGHAPDIEEIDAPRQPAKRPRHDLPLTATQPNERPAGRDDEPRSIAIPAMRPQPPEPMARPVGPRDNGAGEPRDDDRTPRREEARPAPVEIRIIEREIEHLHDPGRSAVPEHRADDFREQSFLLPPTLPVQTPAMREDAGRMIAAPMPMATETAGDRRSDDTGESRADNEKRAPRRSDEPSPRNEGAASRPLAAMEPQRITPRVELLDKAMPAERGRREEGTSTVAPQTIQVTIGRIEVRATTPAKAERRERRGAQVMSIDDYLRQRTGGSR
jgi:hypothetical protein